MRRGIDISKPEQIKFYWDNNPPSDGWRVQEFSKKHNDEYSAVYQALDDEMVLNPSARTILDKAMEMGYGNLL